jgi:hypothetical protein
MPPSWLAVLSWCALGIAFVSAAAITADIFVGGYRQRMGVMEGVWPVTALYFGPLAWWGYRRFGRPPSGRWPSSRLALSRPIQVKD